MSTSGLRHYLFLVGTINMLSSSIYKHVKANLIIQYSAFLIFQEYGIYIIFVFSNIFSKLLTLILAPLAITYFKLKNVRTSKHDALTLIRPLEIDFANNNCFSEKQSRNR